mmetsp:Transcript_110913/g.313749  ORF Transcript_110913/g.313749 Transcript_110913/m.313749 type:complete len:605 (-) Transcript_110913:87-1901(-)
MILVIILSHLFFAASESPSCPCIDAPTWRVDRGRTATNEPCMLLSNGDCYPQQYGIGSCRTWDADFDPACNGTSGADRPAYCDEPFCYVNTTVCAERRTQKTYRQTDLVFLAQGLAYYSYETCGGDGESWSTDFLSQTIRGKTLLAGVPRSFFPEQFMVDGVGAPLADGPITPGASMSGVWIDYLEEMAMLGQFNLKYVPVSNASSNDHGSLWTACAQDVANGIIDLCVGNFWVTPARVGLGVTFITPATIDSFKLMVRTTTKSSSLGERLWSPFAPFTLPLWVSVCCTWLVVGLMYTLLSSRRALKHSDCVSPRALGPDVARTPSTKTSWSTWLWTEMQIFCRLTYLAVMEMGSQTVAYEANELIQKKTGLAIIKMGYAFFVIVTCSCYVGNMAAMRSVLTNVAEVHSIEQCASSPGCTMCIHSQAETYFTKRYPALPYHISSSSKRLILDLFDGKCTISASQGLHFGALGDDADMKRTCDFSFDKEVYHMYVSQPVKHKYAQALSQLSAQLGRQDRFADLYHKYFTSYESLCGSEGNSESIDPLDEAFDFVDFSGLYMVVGLFLLVGVCVDCRHRRHLASAVVKGASRISSSIHPDGRRSSV